MLRSIPTEAESIEVVKQIGARVGYRRLMHILQHAWTQSTRRKNSRYLANVTPLKSA